MVSIKNVVSDSMRFNRRTTIYEMVKMLGPCTEGRVASRMTEHYLDLYPDNKGMRSTNRKDLAALEREGLIKKMEDQDASGILYEVVA